MFGWLRMIETVEDKIGGLSELHTTGNLEPVMKESCQIAYTFAKQFISSLFPGNKFLQSASLHMHIPSGAVKKDGPSAGVTIVTSLVSLALNKPIKDKVAMTGEITLTGRVLRIGGVREKVMAAKQNGKTTVILPVENRADFEKLPEFIRNGVEIHYASHYSDVFKAAFAQPEDQLQPIPDVQLHHPSLVNTNVAKIL
jgi:ATP-dependent Lon protease